MAKMLKSHLGTGSKGREKMKFEFQWTVESAGSIPVKEGTKVSVQWKRGSAKKSGATAVALVDGQHCATWGEQFTLKVTMMSDPLTNNFDRKPLSFSLKDERKKRTIARLSINLGDHVHRTASQSVSFPLVLSSSYSAIKDAAPPTLTLVWYSNLLQVGNRKTQRLQVPAPSAVAHLKKGLAENKRSSRIIGGQEFVLAEEVDTSDASETSLDGPSDEEDVTEFAADDSVVDESAKTYADDISDKEESEHEAKSEGGEDIPDAGKAESPDECSSQDVGDDEEENADESEQKEEKEDNEENEENEEKEEKEDGDSLAEKEASEKEASEKEASEKEASEKDASEREREASEEMAEKCEIGDSRDSNDSRQLDVDEPGAGEVKDSPDSSSSDEEFAAPPQITVSGGDDTQAEEAAHEKKQEATRCDEEKGANDEKGAEKKEQSEGDGSRLGKKKKERKSRSISESDEAKAERKKRKEKKERRKTGDEGGEEDVEKSEKIEKDKSKEKSRDSSNSRHKTKSRKGGRSKDGEADEEDKEKEKEKGRGRGLSSISAEIAAHAKEVEEIKKSKSKNKHLMRSVVEEAAAKASKRSPKISSSSKAVKVAIASEGTPAKKHHKHLRKSMDENALAGLDTAERDGASPTKSSMIPGLDLSNKVMSVLTGSGGKKSGVALTERERDSSKERQRGPGGSGSSDSGSSASATAQAAVGSLWEGLNRVGRALPGPISTDAHKKETGQVMLSMANEVQELKNRITELEREKDQLMATLAGKEKTEGLLQGQVKEMAQSIVRYEQAEQKRVMEERLRIAALQEVAVRSNTRRTRSTDLAILLDPVAASKRRGYLYVLRMIVLILVLLLLRELF